MLGEPVGHNPGETGAPIEQRKSHIERLRDAAIKRRPSSATPQVISNRTEGFHVALFWDGRRLSEVNFIGRQATSIPLYGVGRFGSRWKPMEKAEMHGLVAGIIYFPPQDRSVHSSSQLVHESALRKFQEQGQTRFGSEDWVDNHTHYQGLRIGEVVDPLVMNRVVQILEHGHDNGVLGHAVGNFVARRNLTLE